VILDVLWRLLRSLPPGVAYRVVHSTPPWLARLVAGFERRPPSRWEPVEFAGVRLENPVGLAAGLDKDGNLAWVSYALGFGFTVVGSVLPYPYPGVADKVLARLPDGGLVNRLGLPSKGARVVAGRLSKHRPPLPVAVNIAGLKPGDYLEAYRILAPLADWVEVNISCPNTVEHSSFEEPEQARRILRGLVGLEPRRPILVKIPRTLDDDTLRAYADIVVEAGVDGIVAANTLKTVYKGRQAGLSGPRLYESTLAIVSRLREYLPGGKHIVAVGGVDSPGKVEALLEAGASLVEVLTALLARGPGRVRSIIAGGRGR